MTTAAPDYKLLDHTADLGIEIHGSDLKDLFESAGAAMMHLLVKGEHPPKTSSQRISVSGEDLPDLMVRWLGEILYLFEGERLVITSIYVDSVSSHRLKASLETVPFDSSIHEILREIKAVTYHQIEVANKNNQWQARVIFDI